jgi:hypothetical protein
MLETGGDILASELNRQLVLSVRHLLTAWNLAYRVELSGLFFCRCIWIKLKRCTATCLCLLDGRLNSLCRGDTGIGISGSFESALLLKLGLTAASHGDRCRNGIALCVLGVKGVVGANWQSALSG